MLPVHNYHHQFINYDNFQMLKFLGGEGSSFRLDQDSAGRFISQLTVSHPDDYDVDFESS